MELDDKFPPTLPANSSTVASFIPSRSPEFKVHASAGLCHSALSNRAPFQDRAKYELINGEWVRTWYWAGNATRNCHECDRDPFELAKNRIARYYRVWNNDPRHMGAVWNHKPVCLDCHDRIKAEIEQAEIDMEYREKHERYFLN